MTQRSGNICAVPECGLLLMAQGTSAGPDVVLCVMARIGAETPNGPQADSPLTPKQRIPYVNLILMCNQHHERLNAMKEAHEQQIERRLGGRSCVHGVGDRE
ncbi:MAG TPA: hypothetical protein VJT72_07530 [Pseudonocardiaceae bacterium]|nr:hypothetical protein [Pseudonocardiaceae bacterium]